MESIALNSNEITNQNETKISYRKKLILKFNESLKWSRSILSLLAGIIFIIIIIQKLLSTPTKGNEISRQDINTLLSLFNIQRQPSIGAIHESSSGWHNQSIFQIN